MPGGSDVSSPAACRGVQVREHQRDGLRMFVVDELGKQLWVGLLDGVEGCRLGAQGLGQPVEQPFGDIRREGARQQLAGEFDAAARHIIAGRGDVVEFVEKAFGLFGRDRRDLAPPRG